jgi:hypothetical protein
MTENLRAVVRGSLRPGHSPHIVGAGIGVRCRDGRPTAEMVLTILVKKQVSKEELRSSIRRCKGKELPFEVLDVGHVIALGRRDRSGS